MSKGLLVFRNGRKGAKILDAARAMLTVGDREVRVLGDTRVIGTVGQVVKLLVNRAGRTGTFSVVQHDEDAIDELVHPSQRTYQMLANDLNLIVVGRIRHSMDDVFAMLPDFRASIEWGESQGLCTLTKKRVRYTWSVWDNMPPDLTPTGYHQEGKRREQLIEMHYLERVALVIGPLLEMIDTTTD